MADDAKRRRIRTRVQAAVSAAGVLLVVVPIVLSTMEGQVSAKTWGILVAAAAAVTQGATLVQRIMSAPTVVSFIETYMSWLGQGGK